FEVNTRALAADRVHEATIEVIANGGQRLALTVRVQVRPREEPTSPPPPPRPEPVALPRPRPAAQPATEPARPQVRRPILVAACLALLARLLIAGPADLYARVLALGPAERPAAGTFASWREAPVGTEFVRHFVLATGWVGALVGLVLVLWRGRLRGGPGGVVAGAGGGRAARGGPAGLVAVV